MDEKSKFDRGIDGEFTADSSWTLRGGSSYFFGDGVEGEENSILSDFGWDFNGGGGGFDLIRSDLAGNNASSSAADADAATPSGDGDATAVAAAEEEGQGEAASSCSSDDPSPSAASLPTPPSADSTSKVKKQKGGKRVKQARFAFMTKSEVDHLEDGYRWRKYGQKAVKNSPFPRSYYRCTNSKCTVKKRVERSSDDPTVVITTYEGQHCHHTAGFRGAAFFTHDMSSSPYLARLTPLSAATVAGGQSFPQSYPRDGGIPPRAAQSGEPDTAASPDPARWPPLDEGLLGDMVPPEMWNK